MQLSKKLYYDEKSVFHNMQPPCHVVYIIEMFDLSGARIEAIKIGVTSDPIGRLNAINTGNPFTSKYYTCERLPCRADAFFLEKKIHSALELRRIKGEWFKIHPDDALKVLMDCAGYEEVINAA